MRTKARFLRLPCWWIGSDLWWKGRWDWRGAEGSESGGRHLGEIAEQITMQPRVTSHLQRAWQSVRACCKRLRVLQQA